MSHWRSFLLHIAISGYYYYYYYYYYYEARGVGRWHFVE